MLARLKTRLNWVNIIMGVTALMFIAVLIYGAYNTLTSAKYSVDQWENVVISGLARGSIYALIALGYTLVYGVLRMINFAHSEVFMSGPFTAYFVASALNQTGFLNASPLSTVISLLIIMAVSMLVSLLIAVGLERVAYRPLRTAPRLVPLITAIGASFFLLYTFRGLYGSGVFRYPQIDLLQGSFTILGITITYTQALVIVAALILMAVLYAFVIRTKAGKAMRAVSEDKPTASLMGINIDRSIVVTFMLGGAAAGAAGFFYALIFGQVHFYMGFVPGLKAFTAAVLGGIGSIPGAFVGGILLGVIEALFPNLILDGLGVPAPNQLADGLGFTVLVLVLIFRPSGILGERLPAAKA
jgi:branched-chain amino acid transport system permease protein